jgi:hypothetical protein
MRSEAPPLLPIFRSRHQAELLALLYLQPEREFSLIELAGRLVEAGLLLDRRVGRAHLLRAKAHGRYAKPLTELLTLSFGPHAFIEQEFADVPGVEALAIFGSWARRPCWLTRAAAYLFGRALRDRRGAQSPVR